MIESLNNEINQYDIVRLDPQNTRNPMFSACLMIVTEVKSWGVQGYVQSLGSDGNPGGQAYYRANWDEFVKVGHAEWSIE